MQDGPNRTWILTASGEALATGMLTAEPRDGWLHLRLEVGVPTVIARLFLACFARFEGSDAQSQSPEAHKKRVWEAYAARISAFVGDIEVANVLDTSLPMGQVGMAFESLPP